MKDLFRNRNFTSLLFVRLFSNAGDSLYYVGTMWLVYELTGSTFYTGVAGFLVRFPQVFEFLVGPLVDRWNLQRILMKTQALQAGLLLLIPVAVFLNLLTVEILLFIVLSNSIINRFTYPAMESILPYLVDEERLVGANSLFTTANKSIDLLFTSVGGFLIVLVGVSTFYLVDSLFFVLATSAVLLIEYSVKTDDTTDEGSTGLRENFRSYKTEFKQGARYILDTVVLWFTLRSAVLNFANGMMMAVLPAFASSSGGAQLYGILLAAISVGVLIGSLIASYLEDVPYGRLVIVSDIISGCLWIPAILYSHELVTIVLFGAAWIPVGVTKVIYQSTLQSNVPSNHLGRVMSCSASISVGLMPFGSFIGGIIGQTIGSQTTVLLLGPLFVLVALFWLAVPRLRQLPQMADIQLETQT